ncbi:hypothetical protein, conserved [Babesia ovata]|uniref:C3H1-type domain-containing protein n=1 Tax=Babesia ovata TaxID=189622 RepID=A0A2H6KJZ0_9APIC|nr:uncharacterized protein BOVATA_047990 [Babesia ovata]GBE63306.1 hypothetical protein, conserved [Babesia ovata]
MDDKRQCSLAKEIQEAEEVIKKLREFDRSLASEISDRNMLHSTSSTHLLTKLTEGLETFLGFDSETKGYTGKGIVYSDLDRLCDGVMAFLHGVLETVKGDESVKKYDNYLNTNEKLNDVLQHLHSSIGQGRSVFGTQVGKVNDRTTGVSYELGKYVQDVSRQQDKPLKEQLTKWTKTVTDINNHINNNIITNANKLDPALSDKITRQIEPVQKVVAQLGRVAKNDAVIQQAKLVDDQLLMQKEQIKHEIKENTRVVFKTLNEQLRKINEEIESLRLKRINQFGNIRRAIKDSADFMEAYNHEYKDKITEKFEEIKTEIKDAYTNIATKKAELDGFVNSAWKEYTVLKESVGQNTAQLKTGAIGNWDKLKEEIRNLVFRQIYGHGATDGIKGIVSGIGTYASGFSGKTAFGRLIGEWVNEIVDKEPMKGYITAYVTKNNDKNKFSGNLSGGSVDEMISHMTSIVQDKIAAELKGIRPISPLGNNSTVDGDLSDIVQFLTKFSGEVMDKEDDILFAIEQELKDNGNFSLQQPSDDVAKKDLEKALKTTLTAVASTAKQLSAQLDKFTSTSKIANLTQAIKDVTSIPGKLEDDGSLGNSITEALKTVKSKIEELDKLLLEQTDDQQGSIIKKLGEIQTDVNTFYDIVKETSNGKINEKKKAAEYKMEQLRKALENNFNYIREYVEQAEEVLTHTADAVYQAVVKTEEEVKKGITKLKTSLLSQVEESFSTLTNSIRSLFSASHAADLQALRALVDEQLREVQTIIARDAVTGVKGMINKMYGKDGKNIKLIVDALTKQTSPSPKGSPAATTSPTKDEIKKFIFNFMYFADPLLQYTEGHVKDYSQDKNNPLPTEQSLQVRGIQNASDTLLKYLGKFSDEHNAHDPKNKRVFIFDDKFSDLLSSLSSSISSLSPSTFAGFHNPLLLDALRRGMTQFTQQLGHAYVNKYSGQKRADDWVVKNTKKDTDPSQPEQVLSAEGRNCAKVCLTILETVSEDLAYLKEKCNTTNGPWKHNKICETDENKTNKLGLFFKNRGFTIPSGEGSKQDGQLRCKGDMTGGHICQKLLEKEIDNADRNDHLKACKPNKKTDKFNVLDILTCLRSHLHQYFSVGHISSFAAKKSPCSVYEMLTWCCGLQFNSSYQKMQQHYKTVLEKKKEKEEKEKNKQKTPEQLKDEQEEKEKDAYLDSIMSTLAVRGLPYLSGNSRNILTTILGTGDEHTLYASDFSNNYLNLSYPSSGEACLDTLLDILRRMFPVCRFLYSQCNSLSSDFGWAGCQYGKQVKHANWQCDKHIADKESECVPRSPLMSYFTDSLPGHLPHQLESVGCTYKCAMCPKSKPGQPCLTPLGFRGFSGSTRLGKELCNVLTKMLDDADLRSLFCLKPKTPATLPEHFGFVLSLVKDWQLGLSTNKSGLKSDFEATIDRTSIHLYEHPNKLTDALRDAYGSSQSYHDSTKHASKPVKDTDDEPSKADVSSLCMTITCPGEQCAPYMSSLCGDFYICLPFKHSSTYLSWAIYLPWTFWDLLNNLYNAFCSITCADWGCRGCLRGDKCKSGKHGVIEDEKKQDAVCQCESIVSCRGVAPTLYQYGFTFGEASTLNSGSAAKKCKDFCSQLKNVLQSEYFQKLFKECDNFLKEIRWPFMLTLLSLWSLSLLYLLHIAVVRLDVLRIRSHLRSPSSHRIAAQSLLAAARVRALANVKYFSP